MLTATASTGLRAAMADLQVTGNNVANSNTIGFKESAARFADLYSSGVASGQTVGIGVQVAGYDQDFSSGSNELTGRGLDLAITGEGFFRVKGAGTGIVSYTRAGHMMQDKDGYIVAPSGERLQAYDAIDGVVSANIVDLQIPSEPLPANLTSTVGFNLNMDSGAPIPAAAFDSNNAATYNYRADSVVYDSLGNASSLSSYYVKTATNAWDVHTEVDGVALGSGTMTFNSDGSLNATAGLSALSWTPLTGADAPQILNMGMTGTTQLANPMQTRAVAQDGYSAGTLTSFDFDSDGVATARYSNGETKILGQIVVAKFRAPAGLSSTSNMSWLETGESGGAILGHGNSTGVITAGALEQSNVDLTQQLVKLLNGQHSFQANAQLVRAADELNQVIINI